MTAAQPAAARTGRVVAMAALVALATVLGAWRVAALVAGPADPMTVTVGAVTYTVTHVEQVTGLTDADLGGMSHGVQSLVSDDKALVRVAVTVAAGDATTDYDATVLTAAVAGTPGGIVPVAGSLPVRGRLSAHAQLEGSLSYVVPRNGAHLVLRAGSGSREVPLVDVDDAGDPTPDHDHTGAATGAPSSATAGPVVPLPGYVPPTTSTASTDRP